MLECMCCGLERDDVKEYPNYENEEQPYLWCKLCSSTFASNAVKYNYHDATLYQTVARIGNLILDALAGEGEK